MRSRKMMLALLSVAACTACDDRVDGEGFDPPADVGAIDPGPDMRPIDAAPPDAMPGDVMLGDAMPVDAMSVDAMSVDVMSVDAMSVDVMPVDAMPVDAMPVDAMPVDAMPGDAMPGDAVPDMACLPELCNGLDDDCDGVIDERCGVIDEECVAETCNGLDDDCDGAVDEAVGPEGCYDGPPETRDVGLCRSGSRACIDGAWGPCEGQVLPPAELPLVDLGGSEHLPCEAILALDVDGARAIVCPHPLFLIGGPKFLHLHTRDEAGGLSLTQSFRVNRVLHGPPVVADLDGDGGLDVLQPVPPGVLRVRVGPAGLAQPEEIAYGEDTAGFGGLAVADVRGGPEPDIVLGLRLAEGLRDVVAVLPGAPGGGFRPLRVVADTPDRPTGLIPDDLDGDGDVDLLVTWRAGVGYLLAVDGRLEGPLVEAGGPGHTAIVPPAYRDLDGDGAPELVMNDWGGGHLFQRSVVRGPEGPMVGAAVTVDAPEGAAFTSSAAAQLDCDAELELVATTFRGGMHVFLDPLGQGDAIVLPPAGFDVVATDIDGDGDDDLVVGHGRGVYLWLVEP